MEIRIAPGEVVTIIGENGAAPGHVSFDLFKEALDALCTTNNRVRAIELYRGLTGLGLRECKDYIFENCPKPTPQKGKVCWGCRHRDNRGDYSDDPCFECMRSENARWPGFEPRTLPQLLNDAGYELPQVSVATEEEPF